MTAGNAPQNYRSTNFERAADDWYVEPSWCVEQLADAIGFGKNVIWDPACGSGTIPTVFADRGHPVISTDLRDRGYAGSVSGIDFLRADHEHLAGEVRDFSIVTNPPFKLAASFAYRALQLPALRVAILQQLCFLASAGRWKLFNDYPPSDVLILSKRPSMPPGHMIAELGERAFRGGVSDFCWIVWTAPHDRETRIRWLSPTLPTLKGSDQ